MKKVFLLVAGCGILAGSSFAQTLSQKLQKAFQQFESDSQLRHAISSLYVIDAKTSEVVFERNAQVGLAPASTQKIITSVTAFELLGKEYRYKTELGYTGEIKGNRLIGELVIAGFGDPTLGSFRYKQTADSLVLKKWSDAVGKLGIQSYGTVISTDKGFSLKAIPDGWIRQDIGNYYGAGAYGINWRENQFDLFLRSENTVGGEVYLEEINLEDRKLGPFYNALKAGEKGSGDNAYIYLQDGYRALAGTIPRGEKNFKISGSILDPDEDLKWIFSRQLKKMTGVFAEKGISEINPFFYRQLPKRPEFLYKVFYTHYSPSLDSIIYWFNKKSINLYGEALVKTFAYEKTGFGSTDTGVAIVKKFWQEKGLDEEELNIYDGSGLSPLNRVTTHAQVQILKYAKTKDWFPSFYDALPEYNGMKMKSGTISDVKGFCGYHTAKDGKEYIFSFLVNNYSGRASQLLSKMYKVLDLLK